MKCWNLVGVLALSSLLLPVFAQETFNGIDMNGLICRQQESGKCVAVQDTQNCMVPLEQLDCSDGEKCCKEVRQSKDFEVAVSLLRKKKSCKQDRNCTEVGGKCISKNGKCDTQKNDTLCSKKKCTCCIGGPSTCDRIGNLESLIESMMNSIASLTNNINRTNNITLTTQEMLREFLDNNKTECKRQVNASNCMELLNHGMVTSGVYTIYPEGFHDGVSVYCDQETEHGGWTVFLLRKQQIPQVNFTRTFSEYAEGFGGPNGEHWLGNRVLHSLTGDVPYTLRVEAKDLQNERRTGTWGTFSVGPESTKFTLSIGNYVGSSTLSDALTRYVGDAGNINNQNFSTYNEKNNAATARDCSNIRGKAGWWYNDCYNANPTAPLSDRHDAQKANWGYWTNSKSVAISYVQFKIRP